MVSNAGFAVFAFIAFVIIIILIVINKVRIVELKQLKWEIVAAVVFWISFILIIVLWQD